MQSLLQVQHADLSVSVPLSASVQACKRGGEGGKFELEVELDLPGITAVSVCAR